MTLTFEYGPGHVILVLIASSSIEGSGESVHMPRLTRAFVACIQKNGCR